jgi:hypothetical protein|tara:strand:- start:1373 stop:1597 length:225 start_codon:yes stop_codon:yes gene_type:complete
MSSIDIETVFELWERIKPCIPAKDKLEVAEIFIKVADEAGVLKEDIEDLVSQDKILEEAFDRYYEDDYEEEEEW